VLCVVAVLWLCCGCVVCCVVCCNYVACCVLCVLLCVVLCVMTVLRVVCCVTVVYVTDHGSEKKSHSTSDAKKVWKFRSGA
jgi:uncharacterized membrane protein